MGLSRSHSRAPLPFRRCATISAAIDTPVPSGLAAPDPGRSARRDARARLGDPASRSRGTRSAMGTPTPHRTGIPVASLRNAAASTGTSNFASCVCISRTPVFVLSLMPRGVAGPAVSMRLPRPTGVTFPIERKRPTRRGVRAVSPSACCCAGLLQILSGGDGGNITGSAVSARWNGPGRHTRLCFGTARRNSGRASRS